MSLKETIHQLVEDCKDDAVLHNALEMLGQGKHKADWWNELSEEQKQKTLSSLDQSINGQTITHEMLRDKIWAKFSQ